MEYRFRVVNIPVVRVPNRRNHATVLNSNKNISGSLFMSLFGPPGRVPREMRAPVDASPVDASLVDASSRELASLPPANRRVLVEPECGGGGGCPTIYQLGENGCVIVQGYEPNALDCASVPLANRDRAVVIPESFFEKVVRAFALKLPENLPLGDSCRVYERPNGDVVVKGYPLEDGLLQELKVPDGEVAVSLSQESFLKLIRNVSMPES